MLCILFSCIAFLISYLRYLILSVLSLSLININILEYSGFLSNLCQVWHRPWYNCARFCESSLMSLKLAATCSNLLSTSPKLLKKRSEEPYFVQTAPTTSILGWQDRIQGEKTCHIVSGWSTHLWKNPPWSHPARKHASWALTRSDYTTTNDRRCIHSAFSAFRNSPRTSKSKMSYQSLHLTSHALAMLSGIPRYVADPCRPQRPTSVVVADWEWGAAAQHCPHVLPWDQCETVSQQLQGIGHRKTWAAANGDWWGG